MYSLPSSPLGSEQRQEEFKGAGNPEFYPRLQLESVLEAFDAFGLSPESVATEKPPKELVYEMFRDPQTKSFISIVPQSQDWVGVSQRSPTAFVVRLKTLVGAQDVSKIIEWLTSVIVYRPIHYMPAVHAIGKFSEVSVAKGSPVQYESRMLFVYEDSCQYDSQCFQNLMKDFLPLGNKPYVTIEFLQSFLTRRQFAASSISGEEALEVMKHYISRKEPCSSLFLKLSAHYPDECLDSLKSLAACHPHLVTVLLGERSLHKLAVSVVNKQVKVDGEQGQLRKAMNVLKIGCTPQNWGYVAFNTLMRLAQDEDSSCKSGESQVDLLLSLISVANLDNLDKVALFMMAEKMPNLCMEPSVSGIYTKLMSITCCTQDVISIDNLHFVLNVVDNQQRASSCHILSIILKNCAQKNNFQTGWKIASRASSISKQVFGEVVALCSKAYFAALKYEKDEAEKEHQIWFERIEWCVHRHVSYLNRYPCGLALHVAAHRRQFHKAWEWFCVMRNVLAFRLTGYHTSAVIKAASFEQRPSSEMPKVREAYEMTPPNERTTFVFIPLVRIYEALRHTDRMETFEFWNSVDKHVQECIEENESKDNEGELEKVFSKLVKWRSDWEQWKIFTSDGKFIPEKMVKQERRMSRRRSSHNQRSSQSGTGKRNSFGGCSRSSFSKPSTANFSHRRISHVETGVIPEEESLHLSSKPIGSERKSSTISLPRTSFSSRRDSNLDIRRRDSSLSYNGDESYYLPSRLRGISHGSGHSIW